MKLKLVHICRDSGFKFWQRTETALFYKLPGAKMWTRVETVWVPEHDIEKEISN